MGRLLSAIERRAGVRARRFAFGLVVAVTVPLLWGSLGRAAERWLPWPARALVLKPTFAGRALLRAGVNVEDALAAGDLTAARPRLSALVSRQTSDLDEGLVAAAAIESLAENLTDSWVAPLLAHCVGGLGGAYAYRAANTADAMWGYRSPRHEQLGKGAARLDDVLNWLPARVAALALVAGSGSPVGALGGWWRDAGQTSSPNAGQTMAAAAGALGVRLEKRGAYVLNAHARVPTPTDVAAARRLVRRAMTLSAMLPLMLPLWRRR
jgi:adenosylcobinamide-phosphate synthase